MYEAHEHANDCELGLLLAGASKLVKSVQNCWLLTQSDPVGINARPMGRVLPEDEEGDWRIRFLTDLCLAGDARRRNRCRVAGHVSRLRSVGPTKWVSFFKMIPTKPLLPFRELQR